MYLTHLQCTECQRTVDPAGLIRTCPDCARPLVARYDLEQVRRTVDREEIERRPLGLWKYREVLPAPAGVQIITLGEGGTPILDVPRLAELVGLAGLRFKDDSLQPTGSFKARGMSVAVTMAKHFGATALSAPSAGNAGGAMAAYGARAGLPVHVAMPKDVPMANRIEATACGANVTLVDGTIADCGKFLAQRNEELGAFDLSTLKEPYRVEGKKTMGYELAEQLGWTLPDYILYPTGGGTGLVGMAKAFDEMRELGWIDAPNPKFIAVQAAGCAPIADAYSDGTDDGKFPESPATCAAGLRVPTPIGDRWMLRVIRDSEGQAVSVTDEELMAGTHEIAQTEGMFLAPEAGALWVALQRLRQDDTIPGNANVVLFVTGNGLKYLELFENAESRA